MQPICVFFSFKPKNVLKLFFFFQMLRFSSVISHQSFKMKTTFFFFNPSKALYMFLTCSYFFATEALCSYILCSYEKNVYLLLLKLYILSQKQYFCTLKRRNLECFDSQNLFLCCFQYYLTCFLQRRSKAPSKQSSPTLLGKRHKANALHSDESDYEPSDGSDEDSVSRRSSKKKVVLLLLNASTFF